MKTGYKFKSIHLGQAFMKELEDIGYKNKGYKIEEPSIILDKWNSIPNQVNFASDEIGHKIDIIFQLEVQYSQALQHAKEQLVENSLLEGKWYKGKEVDQIILYRGGNRGVGFVNSSWGVDWAIHNPEEWREATTQEVEQALILYALLLLLNSSITVISSSSEALMYS